MGIKSQINVLVVGGAADLGSLERALTHLGWQWVGVADVPAAVRYMRDYPQTEVVVLAAPLTPASQMECCRAIKEDQRTHFTMVVALHPADCDAGRAEMWESQVDDYISMAAPVWELEARLARVWRFKRATDSLEDSSALMLALAATIEGKDHYTCGHVERVESYAVEIGRRAGLEAEALETLKLGAILHDIGKIGVPDHILNKPGKLTAEEMAVMRQHPIIGYEILKPLRTFRAVLPIIRWHHERPNGTGYPDGLRSPEIQLLARITAVADVFDALATDRPYRPAMALEKCRAVMLDEAKVGNLDADLVRVLLKLVGNEVGTGAGV